MEKTAVQKLAGALKVLVTITLVCNLVALLLVPGMSLMKGPEELLALTPYENPLEVPLRVGIAFVLSWGRPGCTRYSSPCSCCSAASAPP